MESTKEHLASIAEIKDLMEKSTKFISLSGLSGVIAGITALAGASLAYLRLDHYLHTYSFNRLSTRGEYGSPDIVSLITELILIAMGVLFISLTAGYLLTLREAKKNNQSIWGKNSMSMLGSLLIPLAAGGLLSLIFIYHYQFVFVAPTTLIFYGLALVSASKFTLKEIKYLGIFEIVLGLLNAVFIGKGLIFWAIGFGVLHIVYGAVMHFKYNS